MFSGIPILEFDNLRCGIGIVDLQLGKVVGTFEFEAGVEEIFAVEPLLGITNPLFSGSMQKGAVRELWLIPETEHSKRSDDPLERA